MALTECCVDDCAKGATARKMCPMHYQRWRRHGTTSAKAGTHDPAARFWALVDQGDGDRCWLWRGEVIHSGYGRIVLPGKKHQMAHRFAYELLVGPIPTGLVIDHVRARGCTNLNCVNPAHLEAVTQRVNLMRGNTLQARNAAKTHCDSGHEFTDENTYRDKTGGRHCRRCASRWASEYRARRMAAT